MGNIHTWVRVASVARPYQDDCRVQLQDGGHEKKRDMKHNDWLHGFMQKDPMVRCCNFKHFAISSNTLSWVCVCTIFNFAGSCRRTCTWRRWIPISISQISLLPDCIEQKKSAQLAQLFQGSIFFYHQQPPLPKKGHHAQQYHRVDFHPCIGWHLFLWLLRNEQSWYLSSSQWWWGQSRAFRTCLGRWW